MVDLNDSKVESSEVPEGAIAAYNIDKAKRLCLVRSSGGTALYVFRFEGGGELPPKLKGSFTGKSTADVAVAVYLEYQAEGQAPVKSIKQTLKK
jgi:hypothetical protein